MSNSALNELGFAEFVAKLISDTFNAILSSQADQKNKINELRALLAMDKEEFIDACMQDEALLDQLDTELQFLFTTDNEVGHSVIAGSVYTPHKGSVAESPAYSAVLGITLIDKEDFYQKKVQPPKGARQQALPKDASKYYLSDKGVDKIKRAIMARIAHQQRASINSMMADGIPRLVVDSGKINAKLTFATELFDHNDDEEEVEEYKRPTPIPPPGASQSSASSTGPVRRDAIEKNLAARRVRLGAAAQFSLNTNSRFLGAVDTQRLAYSRLKITPASNKVPQDVSSKTNIYSEVEIHFKTIL